MAQFESDKIDLELFNFFEIVINRGCWDHYNSIMVTMIIIHYKNRLQGKRFFLFDLAFDLLIVETNPSFPELFLIIFDFFY
jgi:hypothetical protein